MTVQFADGNMFSANTDCLVNPVNCVGVMGAGLAKQFAFRWPAMLDDYRKACSDGRCSVGQVYMWRPDDRPPAWIANLPTKVHWRDPSQLAYVQAGLDDLADQLDRHSIGTVVIPALGCGLGGLPWGPVRDAVISRFADSPVQVLLYPPAGSSPAAALRSL